MGVMLQNSGTFLWTMVYKCCFIQSSERVFRVFHSKVQSKHRRLRAAAILFL